MGKKTKKEIKVIYRHGNQIIAELKSWAIGIAISIAIGFASGYTLVEMIKLINQLRGTAA